MFEVLHNRVNIVASSVHETYLRQKDIPVSFILHFSKGEKITFRNDLTDNFSELSPKSMLFLQERIKARGTCLFFSSLRGPVNLEKLSVTEVSPHYVDVHAPSTTINPIL